MTSIRLIYERLLLLLYYDKADTNGWLSRIFGDNPEPITVTISRRIHSVPNCVLGT